MVILASTDLYGDLGRVIIPGLWALVVIWVSNIFGILLKFLTRPRHESPAETLEMNYKIQAELELTLTRLGPNAMRVYYSKFHNGDFFDDSSPIQKKTRVNEALRDGISPVADRYATMVISRIPDEIALIQSEGPSFTYVHDLPKGTFRYLCQEFGVEAVARAGVYKGKRYPQNLIGFVGVDFDHGGSLRHPPRPDNIDEVTRLADRISHLTSIYKASYEIPD